MMQLIYSSTMAFCSIHVLLPHRCPIPMLHMQRLPMQYISSHNTPSSTSLIPWTTHDTKKSVIDSSVTLTNGPVSLRVVLCGKSQYIVFNSLLNQSSLSLRAPQRTLFLEDTQWNWTENDYVMIHSGMMRRTSFVECMN